MKKILLGFILGVIYLISFAQPDWNTGLIRPKTVTSLQSLDNATFYINKPDTGFWVRLGRMGDLKLVDSTYYHKHLPKIIKGSLSTDAPALHFSSARYVIGGPDTLSLNPGFVIPTTVSATDWDNKEPAITLPAVPDPWNYYWNGEKYFTPMSVGSGGYAANIYFTTKTSTLVSTYRELNYIPEANTTTLTETVTNQELLIRTYLAPLPLETELLDAGEWSTYFKYAVSNAVGITQIKFEAFLRHINGTETTLFSFYTEELNSTTPIGIKTLRQLSSYSCANTDYLGARIYFKTTSPTAITIYTYVGNGDASYFNTPLKLRHEQLRDLNWSVNPVTGAGSGHTGTPNSLAAFDAGGLATTTLNYSGNWNTSYERSPVGLSVTGTDPKIITLTKQDGNTLTATFTSGISSYPTAGIVVSSGSTWSPSISTGSGYMQNNGSNIYSWNYPEITSLRSTGATNGYVATSNGSGGVELRQPSINVTSFIKQKSIANLYNFAHSSVVYNDMLFIGERRTDPKIVKWANVNDLNTISSITISGVGSSGAGLETGFYVSSISKICFVARNYTSGFDIVEVDPTTMAYTQHNFPSITGLNVIGNTDGTYIYIANYNSIHKIRVSDWTDILSTGLPSGLVSPHSIQVNPSRSEFYVTGYSSTSTYLAKISTVDLTSSTIDISSYVSLATDDMFFYDDGTNCKLFICGEQNISGQPFGGVIVNTVDNSLTQLKLNPSYGLFRDGVKAYSCGINGDIQTFSVLDPTNISTFPMTGFIPNEVLATSSGRTFFTNWDSYNSVICEFFVPVPMPDSNNLVTSVFGRTGDVVANTGDYDASQVTNAAATNAANIFTTDQTIAGANTNIIVKTDAGTGSGLLVKDGSNFNKIAIGWNPSSSEGFIWTYGGSNLPIKIGTNGTERWRFKTDGVFETINLSSFPSASRSGFGGFFTYNNLPYFINSSGVTTQLGAGGGSMVYPSGTGLAVVNSGSSWGTTIALSGNSGQFLNGNGVFTTPIFSSQWTTDANGYGISYTSNVGIGTPSSNILGLYVYKNLSAGYAGYFQNANSSGFGAFISTAANDSKPILALSGNTSTPRFDFNSDGSMYAYSLANVDQSYVLGYNNSTGQITYLPKPSGGGGSGTVTSFSSGNLSPLFTTSVANSTTTPALSFSAVSQAQNLVYASPNSSSGTPTFRKIVVGDISASGTPSSNTYLDGTGTWSTPIGLPITGVWGTNALANGTSRTQSIGLHTVNKIVELYYTIKRNNVMYGHGKIIFYTYYDGSIINVTKDETQSLPGSGITIDMTTGVGINYGLQITNNSGVDITMSASYVYLVNSN